jgi:hypothetical protein
MLLLEGYISNFTRPRYYFLCVEFSDFYVNQSLTGQTIRISLNDSLQNLDEDVFLQESGNTPNETKFQLSGIFNVKIDETPKFRMQFP